MNPSRAFRVRRPATWPAMALMWVAAACSDGPVDPEPSPVAVVEVSPEIHSFLVGEVHQFRATLRAADGVPLTGRTVAWSSSDESVATVDAAGVVRARATGSATIRATSEGVTGQGRLRVREEIVIDRVEVQPSELTLLPGGIGELLSIVLRAPDGSTISLPPADRISWASSDPSVAVVSGDGRVVGVRGGSATITVTVDGKMGTARVHVPLTLEFDLRRVGGQTLPGTVETVRFQDRNGVDATRWIRADAGSLRLSTVDGTYRQTIVLDVSEEVYWLFDGIPTLCCIMQVERRTVEDAGTVGRSPTSGEYIFGSSRYPGVQFVGRSVGTELELVQPIGGQGPAVRLRFGRR